MTASTEITNQNQTWVERLIGTLQNPRDTFARIHAENAKRISGFGSAALLVLLVFCMDGLRNASIKSGASIGWNVFGSLLLGFLSWFSLAALVAILASCFGRNGQNIRGIVVSFGWTFTPWILMAPLFCYENVTGSFFAVLATIPALWIFVLQILAIMENFSLRWWQALLLAFVAPTLFTLVQILQFVQSLYVSMGS